LFNKNPPKSIENKITKFANKLAAERFLKAVAKHKHKPAAAKLNKIRTSKNLPKMGKAEFNPTITNNYHQLL
jgi:hypothetical protein